MTDQEKVLEKVEIYPNIVVYKNLFKNIEDTYKVLKESTDNNDDRLFSKWSKWSYFGEYINPLIDNFPSRVTLDSLSLVEPKTEKEQQHKDLLIELLTNFYIATEDYVKNHDVDFDKTSMVKDTQGNDIPLWEWTGPSIAKYKDDIEDIVAMTYHSDYIRQPIVSPGYKFAITALAYFNDDYEGGEIDFVIGNKLYKYKPEAGDYLVFPSGHPDILTEDGIVYLHGVMPATGPNKFLSRMYWMKYSQGDQEWFDKEQEFGEQTWLEMQDDIMQKFRDEHPNRSEILGGVRIK